MKIITSIFQWVVFSNLWISLGVAATAYVGMQLGILPLDFSYCIVAGLATMFAYNIQRIFKLKDGIQSPSERHIWIEKNRKVILLLSVSSLISAIILSINSLSWLTVFYSIPFIVIVLLYAYSLGRLKALRQIPFAKIVIISAVWSWTIAVLPVLNKSPAIQLDQWAFIIFIFLFVFSLCIPFDIRDLENDKSKIKTIPIVLGVNNALIISIVLLAICLYISFYFDWIVLESIVIIVSIIILSGGSNRKELYYTGLLDGMFLLLFVIYKLYSLIL